MIHVNFLEDFRILVKSGTVTETLETFGTVDVIDENQKNAIQKDALKNGLILFIGVIGLYFYEMFSKDQKVQMLHSLNNQLNEIAEKNAKAKNAVEQVRQLRKEQEKVQKQIQAIEDLKKGRMRPYEVLDVLQRYIPSQAWVEELQFNEEKVVIRGFSTSENAITELIDSLSRQAIFTRVDLLRTSLDSSKSREPLRRFEIECKLEKKL